MTANEGSTVGGVPPEVITFLSGKGGRSLIVKGGAGSGKTTFGLELLERVGQPTRSFYLSTRVGDEALYRQFPWLKSTEMRTRVLDAAKLFLDAIQATGKGREPDLPETEQRKVRAGKEVLSSFGQERGPPTRVDRAHLQALLKRSPMPEVENVYNRIEKSLPEKSLLVIDSLEGVTHKYGLEMEEFVMALQKDLVEGSSTDVVMILEKPEAGGIEYLVDGLISIQREELDERRVRHLRLEKLRATNIGRARYAVTLDGGRFEALGIIPNSTSRAPIGTVEAAARRGAILFDRDPRLRPAPGRWVPTRELQRIRGRRQRRDRRLLHAVHADLPQLPRAGPRDHRRARRGRVARKAAGDPRPARARRTSSTPASASPTTRRTRPRTRTSCRWPGSDGTRRCARW